MGTVSLISSSEDSDASGHGSLLQAPGFSHSKWSVEPGGIVDFGVKQT